MLIALVLIWSLGTKLRTVGTTICIKNIIKQDICEADQRLANKLAWMLPEQLKKMFIHQLMHLENNLCMSYFNIIGNS